MNTVPFEVIESASLEVACDGGNGPLGHPRVFLHIDPDSGEVTCPYCSRTYVLKAGQRASGH
ncbi:MAG: zinc-finger domain-containing protein [Pseudomonadota bacterium]|nr:zinc-finger domain-containing protein [Pseudomonadota bacterium]